MLAVELRRTSTGERQRLMLEMDEHPEQIRWKDAVFGISRTDSGDLVTNTSGETLYFEMPEEKLSGGVPPKWE